jgi:uncharacterized SAM-binding protein YcdF (DUF218 family)
MFVFKKQRLMALILSVLCIGLCFVLAYWHYTVIKREMQPRLAKYDGLVVLGCPANSNGKPSSTLKLRLDSALYYYNDSLADYILVTGGAAHNQHIEAEVMANYLKEAGVDSSKIVVEDQAQNTSQNASFSMALMDQSDWKNVLVITTHSHAKRTKYYFKHETINCETLGVVGDFSSYLLSLPTYPLEFLLRLSLN